jgi:RNA polymerase sigma factor (sigma-70 family)
VTRAPGVEGLLRELAPQVLGGLVRRYGRFDECEDAVQEALLEAAVRWPAGGVPENPGGWLATVASRRLIDQLRSTTARRRREEAVAGLGPREELVAPPADAEPLAEEDDTLTLLFLCCHPALSPASQVALTLRAVGGLTTAEVAGAFLVPEATMAQRISRAKAAIKASGVPFGPPPEAERSDRLAVVLHVLYLIFNEGYTASSGPDLQRAELTREAIRLARAVRRLLPDDGEVAGLLALLLLTDARRAARTGAGGVLVPLAEQDRSRWDRALIAVGLALVTAALSRGRLNAYGLQAAIAAVHAEAPSGSQTDWREIAGLYALLERLAPTPMVTLGRAVAVGMVEGPQAGLEIVRRLEAAGVLAGHHRLAAVRGHLLEMAGAQVPAGEAYREAARRTTSLPERRYLESRSRRLAGGR